MQSSATNAIGPRLASPYPVDVHDRSGTVSADEVPLDEAWPRQLQKAQPVLSFQNDSRSVGLAP